MSDFNQEPLRRVLIASANPLFAKGLQKMVAQRWSGRRVEVRMASSMDEVTAALDAWGPDLVIVDYDDAGRPGNISRAAFLSHFIAENRPMQVMLVSLRESGEVVVYDRRTLSPAQVEDWLDLPWANPEENLPAAPVSQSASHPSEAQSSFVSKPVPTGSLDQSSSRSGGMKHYVIAGVLTLILTAIVGLFLTNIGLMPVAAATQAGPVDSMINLQSWLIAFLFSLITVFIMYSVFVFRAKPGQTGLAKHYSGSNRLEVLWTLIPLGLVLWLSFIGAKDLAVVKEVDPGAVEVKVTAFQWGWIFEYPDYGVQANTLYMPLNRQVHFTMSSRDVIHSFWIPEMRIKQDVLPGQNLVKELRLTADRAGDYKVRCAEMCGGAHAYMESPVKVVTQQQFDDWITQQKSGLKLSPQAQTGRDLANANACTGCHSIDGSTGSGPTWKGLAGGQQQLADGSTVTADDNYLHESIVNPNAKIVKGFQPNLMPQNYGQKLNDEQIKALIEFIKALK